MGEEKPDEELMGKRKSSPRLSPAFLRRRYYHCDPIRGKYTHRRNKISKKRRRPLGLRFCLVPDCGNIGTEDKLRAVRPRRLFAQEMTT